MPSETNFKKRILKERNEKVEMFRYLSSNYKVKNQYNPKEYNFVCEIPIKFLNNFFNICVDPFFKSSWILDNYIINKKVLEYNKSIGSIKNNVKDLNPFKTGILNLYLPNKKIEEFPEVISKIIYKNMHKSFMF